MKKVFVLLWMLFSINAVFSQNIVKAEYFLDSYQGQGNGTAVPNFIQGDIVNFPLTIPTTQLSSGFHFLYIRVADVNGVWSQYETRAFYLSTTSATNATNISGAEYFIGADPGVGGGIPVNIGSPASVVNFPVSIPAPLSSGFHSLSIRVKDQEGKWSLFEQRSFYVAPSPIDASPIVAAEYFYDVDPGLGNAAALNVAIPGGIITQTFFVPVPNSLSQGDHVLAIRVKDQEGHWSFYAKDTITVGAASGSITCPGNVTIDPFTNNCKAVVVNIDAVGLPEDDSTYTYTMTGATTGSGIGTASGQLFNPGVTTVTYALINSPTVSCSFTVTVNSSVTPTSTISIPYTTLCEGTLATLVCTYTGGGFFTTSWQWKKNGINVGTNSNIYRDSTLQNSDAITVAVTSAISCAVPQTVTSAPVVMTVHETVAPSVNVVASATTICPGQLVTFTATPTNGGSQPIYEWMKNGSVVGVGTVYQTSALVNGDSVCVMLHNTTDCVTNSPVKSNVIYITTSQMVTPSVSITASQTTICPGTSVTFTATPVNGGTPSYSWRKNGIPIPGNESNVFQSSLLANGDKVTCVMTSTLPCATEQTGISNEITITVTQNVLPLVTILPVASAICSGTTVTFTASPTNGGPDPSYQWKVNGNNVDGNSVTYETAALNDGDIVSVVMTSSLECASPSSVSSGGLMITVLESSPAFVNIVATATTICSGTAVTFTASPTGGGNSTYQWKLNGNDIPGATGTTYQSSSLQNGDKIKVVMTPSSPCAFPSPATSNEITMTVNSAATPSVSIDASATTICPGEMVTFTATPVNAGNNIAYEWILNSNVVGSNSPTYQNASLANGDKIKITMTSSQVCGGYTQAVSNTITMAVSSGVTPSVSINASAIDICAGQQVTFTATPTNGGNNPTYQWKLNGNNVGSNSPTYQTTSLENADTIKVVMTSSLGCVTSPTATSNSISMDVSASVLSSVSIAADRSYICQGELVSFTATPTNGGNPTYEWKVNGVTVATTNSNTYQSSALEDGDFIVVWMTTSLGCAGPLTVPSNTIVMNVSSQLTYYRDLDGDGYGNASSGTSQACGPYPGWVASNTDCNDGNSAVHPGATEVCGNSIDDDCDGQTDEACGSPDNDSDGYTIAQGDCNDNNANIHPGATEICGNSIDDNCDGQVDEDCNASAPLPVLILRTYPVKEGDAGQTILHVEVNLDIPAPLPVSVQYSTINDDAMAGSDYVATNGVLVIPAGSTSGSLQVRIIGDLLRESNERFRINFTNPVNAVLNGDPSSRIMIIDNDKGKNNNNAAARSDQAPVKEEIFKIPTVTRRNQVWVIPQIGNYENEVLVVNVQGQVVSRFVNYHNQASLGNVSTGLYFYRIRIIEKPGQYKYYSGRLMITE